MPHTQLLFAIWQLPSVCVSAGCSCIPCSFPILLVSNPWAPTTILGAEETRHMRSYSPKGDTSTGNSVQLLRIISVGCAKTGGNEDHAAENKKDHRAATFAS